MFFRKKEIHKPEYEKAGDELMFWSNKQNAPIYRVDFFLGYDLLGLGVYVFYKTNAELTEHLKNGMVEQVKQEFIRLYKATGIKTSENLEKNRQMFMRTYGVNKREFDEVYFNFDTDENVKEKYNGDYFHRVNG